MPYSNAELLAIADVIELEIAAGSPHAFQWNSVDLPEPLGWSFTHVADADALQAELEWLTQNPDGMIMPPLHF